MKKIIALTLLFFTLNLFAQTGQLKGTNVWTGSNVFSGPVNGSMFSGGHSGNGGGLTNLSQAAIVAAGAFTNFQQSLRWPDQIDIIAGTSMDVQLYASNPGVAYNYNWSVHGGGDLASTVAFGITNGIYYYSNGLPYASNNFCYWDFVTNGFSLQFGANVRLKDPDAVPGGCLGDEAFGFPASQSSDGLAKTPGQYSGSKYRPPFYVQQGGSVVTPPYIYTAQNSPLINRQFKWAVVGFPQNDFTTITNFVDVYRNLTNVWNLLRQDGYRVIQEAGYMPPSFYTNGDATKGLVSSGIEFTNLVNDMFTNPVQPDLVLNLYSISSTNNSFYIDNTHPAKFYQTNIIAPFIVSSLASNLSLLQPRSVGGSGNCFNLWPFSPFSSAVSPGTNNINIWSVSNLLAFHTYRLTVPTVYMSESSGALGGIRWDMYCDGTGLYGYTTYLQYIFVSAGNKEYNWQANAGNSLVGGFGLTSAGLNQFDWKIEAMSSIFQIGATNCNFIYQFNPYTNAAASIRINQGANMALELVQ